MTTKQRNIAIFAGIGAITIGYFIYIRKKNNEEATALLEYIATIPSQVNLSEATQQGMDAVRGTKIDLNKMAIIDSKGKLLKGSYKTPAIRDAIAKTVSELKASMQGAGTDAKSFALFLSRVRNKNTLALIDQVYKAMFKEGLFEAMKDEASLNNVHFARYSDKTKNDIAIPFFSDAHWHPNLSAYFNTLPMY
jgi:hypothetical protein